MYDTNKIKEWKLAVQEEINRLISDRALALRQIVLSEIAPEDRLEINMGLATLEDSSGQSYTWDYGTISRPEKPGGIDDFISELTRTTRPDYFDTTVDIGV